MAGYSGIPLTRKLGFSDSCRVRTTNPPDDYLQLALPLGLVDVKVCAVDDVWPGLKLFIRKELRNNFARKIMQKLIVAFYVISFSFPAIADEAADKTAVIRTIDEFFAAMTARDVEKMRSLMTPDGILYGYRETPDGLRIARPTHAAYLENLAAGENTLVERYWDPQVMVYGRLATAWTPYDLHVDGNFSHCGVNNFSLLRTDEGWVVTGVVFSIEDETCEESPLGPFTSGQ